MKKYERRFVVARTVTNQEAVKPTTPVYRWGVGSDS